LHSRRSGNPKPSRADIEMTRKVKTAAGALGIAIHDHPGERPQRPCELQKSGLLS
jgi:DNA repair protein RadC